MVSGCMCRLSVRRTCMHHHRNEGCVADVIHYWLAAIPHKISVIFIGRYIEMPFQMRRNSMQRKSNKIKLHRRAAHHLSATIYSHSLIHHSFSLKCICVFRRWMPITIQTFIFMCKM